MSITGTGRWRGYGAEWVGLGVIGALLVAGLLMDVFVPLALALAGLFVLFIIAGDALGVLLATLALQIVLTHAQLSVARLYIGSLALRMDDLLTLWLLFLWVLTLPDRSRQGAGERVSPGLTGTLVAAFVLLSGVAVLRGITGGDDRAAAMVQLKTFGAYVMYFPLLWVLASARARRLVWRVLLWSGVLGGVIFALKGLMGRGEGVYYRETGLRIATRQPNAVAAVLLLFLGRLWKDWERRPPLMLTLAAIVVMGTAVLVSQTRGIWGGILLALSAAWLLNLFRRRDGVRLSKRMLVSLTALALMVIFVVFSISAAGIISAADVAERTGSESGNYLTDASIMARLFAWATVTQMLSGQRALTGYGFGATYTTFRPDWGEVRTMPYVDSSYFQTALNMGLIGVALLLAIYLTATVRAARLFLGAESRARAGIAMGIFCALVMLMFASAFASVMTNYRFTLLWVLLIAWLQVEWEEERKRTGPRPTTEGGGSTVDDRGNAH